MKLKRMYIKDFRADIVHDAQVSPEVRDYIWRKTDAKAWNVTWQRCGRYVFEEVAALIPSDTR